jgi:hypothetical protein
MKIIENKHTPDPEFPKMVQCGNCNSTLLIEAKDIINAKYVRCEACNDVAKFKSTNLLLD